MTTELVRLLAVSTSGAIVVFTAITLYAYVLAWWRAPRGIGLLPAHVVLVSVYTLNSTVKDTLHILDLIRDDRPLTFFGPMTLAGNTVLLVALAAIFTYDNRRISAANLPPTLADERRRSPRPERRWWGRVRKRR